MVISNNGTKSIPSIPTSITDKKSLSTLGVEGNFLNPKKGIYEKPIANIIPNSKTFSRSGTSIFILTASVQHCSKS